MKKCTLLLLLVIEISGAFAQTLPTRRYTTADGLISDRITCLSQDERGFLWIGTYFGLSRYDGHRFTTVPLPEIQRNKYVSNIVSTSDAVYAGFLFDGGLMEYRDNKVRALAMPSNNNVYLLCRHSDKGILILDGNRNIYHFADNTFKLLFNIDERFKNSTVWSMAMDKARNIWIGTDRELVVYRKDGKQVALSSNATFYLQPADDGVFALFGNQLRFSLAHITATGARRDIWRGTGYRHAVQENFHPRIFALEDTAGNFRHVSSAGLVSSIAMRSVVPDDVQFLYTDRENNLWVGTQTGLVKIANLPARFYAYDEIAFGTGDITGNDSLLWISNGKHIYSIRNGTFSKLEKFPHSTNHPTKVLLSGADLWAGGALGGLWRLRVQNNQVRSWEYFDAFKQTHITIHSLVRDGDSIVWASGQNGIFLIHKGKPVAHFQPRLKSGKLCFPVCIALDAQNKTIWAGDNAEGLLKIKYEGTGSNTRFTLEQYIDSAAGLTDPNIRSILLDSKQRLWIGTRFGGLFNIALNKGRLQVQNVSAQAGLQCTRVTDIKETGNKEIWVSTCNGIYRYSPATTSWRSFTVADGLHSAEIFASHASPSADKCWALSETGLTVFQISDKVRSLPPLVNITGIHVLGEEDTAAVARQQAPDYRPHENSIGFQFAAASYTDERRILYKYMLQGYDRHWSAPTRANSIDYVSLPPGQYTFKVIASTGHDQWSETPASFTFTITRPFYKSLWFIILMLVTVFAAIYYFRMFRLRQKLKLEKLRSRISADLHDEIGSTLSSIAIISEGALQEENGSTSRQMMREINDNAVALLDKMDDIIWCVNPRNDSFGHLMARVKKHAAAVFEAKDIDYDINIDKKIPESSLPMSDRQNLYLILKESINNLVKYSEASYVSVNMQLNGNYIDTIVQDNGKGFDTNAAPSGNGLHNMRKRAALMKAMLRIESNEKGTTVFLRSKIK
ncbi:MAG TPA: two-component regulator propeller domain-containing protein [Chitinophagaceae bacterium]|nr:two-component regulator propeller domain-containing protein [Chitinophagaceae bacterium]